MRSLPRHGNEKLRTLGVYVMVVGLVAAVLPAPAADPLADAHEIYAMVARQIWWQSAGWSVVIVGNVMRLIGTQGHPGLPWPLYGQIDTLAMVRWIVRKRLAFHRRHPGVTLRRRAIA